MRRLLAARPSLSSLVRRSALAAGAVVLSAAAGLTATGQSPASLQRDVRAAFEAGRYEQAVALLEAAPAGLEPTREALRFATLSFVRLGRPEDALRTYGRLVPIGRADEVGLLRDVAWSFLAQGVRDPRAHVRLATYRVLADLADAKAVPLLEDGLLDPSPFVRAQAAEGLGRAAERARRAGKQPPIAALRRAAADPAPSVRVAVLDALGQAEDAGARDLMARTARSEDGPGSVFALAGLVRLGRSDALAEIVGAATLPDPETRMAAVGALGKLKRPATLSALAQSIYDPNPAVRAFAAGALGEFGSAAGAPALTHALGDEDPRVRSAAAASLGRLHLADATPLLWQAARDPVELVRAAAVEGLLRLGETEALLMATDLARHPDPMVRGAAAFALGQAAPRKALPVLEPLLKDPQPQPRLAAVRALGKFRGPDPVPLLKQALTDADSAVRNTAAGSLIQVVKSGKS